MYLVDITTSANYFGRVTGITRTEMMIARALAADETEVQFVYWSNDKLRFEQYEGPLEYDAVRCARLGFDYSRNIDPLPPLPIPEARGLIVTGSSWLQNTTYTLGVLEHAASAGLPTLFYVHDLIPSLFTHYYTDAYVDIFERNLKLIVAHGDAIACNSHTTKQDLLDWCAQHGLSAPNTTVCYLGDDFDNRSASSETEASPLPARLGARDIVLAVGAIHRRKNYELLVSVWRRLAARMGGRCPDLVIVGGVTPDGFALAREIECDRVLRPRIHILSDIDNAMLERLYGAASLAVYPSHYEGWGLPVAEALARNRICLTSQAPAVREIADLGADALPADDVPAWASRIQYYLQTPAARQAREAEIAKFYKSCSWNETAHAVVQALENAPSRPPPVLFDGDEIDLTHPKGQAYLRSRSHGPSKAGETRWVSDATLRLVFRRPATARPGGRVLRLTGLTKRTPRPLTVRLNGHVIATRSVPETCDLELPIAKDFLAENNLLEIEGDLPSPLPQSEKKPWATRNADIGLKQVALLTPDQAAHDRVAAALLTGAGTLASAQGAVAVPAMSALISNHRSSEHINGAIRLNLTDWRPAQTADDGKIWLELTDLPPEGALRLAMRANGSPVAAASDWPETARADTKGRLSVGLPLKEVSGPTHLELVILDHEAPRQVSFRLVSAWAPATRIARDVARTATGSWPTVAVKQYLKFGETDPVTMQVQAHGWGASSFGVTSGPLGVLAFRLKDSTRATTQAKLYLKLQGAETGQVHAQINGIPHVITARDVMENHFLPLPANLTEDDPVSIVLSAQSYGRGKTPGVPPQIVLRGLEILP